MEVAGVAGIVSDSKVPSDCVDAEEDEEDDVGCDIRTGG